MSKNTILPIGLPLLGWNTINPFVDAESGYARELTNYAIADGRLRVRPGVRSEVYNSTLTAAGRYPVWFDVNTHKAILDDGKIRDLDDGSGATSISPSIYLSVTACAHAGIELIFGIGLPRDPKDPFTPWTFTTTGSITADSIIGGCSHKGRLYVHDPFYINYSNVGAVTGAMIGELDVSPYLPGRDYTAIVTAPESISRIFSFSPTSTTTTDNVLIVFGTLGTVLIFAGLDPASATWQLIGKYSMPPPINPQCIIEVDGDIFVATGSYCYWARDLFNTGAQSAYESSPSKPIENFYRVQADNARYSSGVPSILNGAVYWAYLDAILLRLNDEDTIANGKLAGLGTDLITLVYFRKYKAWALWVSTGFNYPYIVSNETLYAASESAEIVKMGPIYQAYDNKAPSSLYTIEATWKTPYYPSFNGKAHSLNGVRTFYQNSVNGYFHKIRSIFDYSDYNFYYGLFPQSTSSFASTVPGVYHDSSADLAAVSWNQYSPRIGTGGKGGAMSLQFTAAAKSGSAEASDINLYAAAAYIQQGGDNF